MAHQLTRLDNTPANARKVAEVLVDAFSDDPVINAFLEPIKDSEARLTFRQQKWFHVLALAATLNEGEMYEVNGFQGVSIWMPPNTDVGNPWTMLPAGLLSMLWGLGVRGVARMLGPGLSAADDLKKSVGVKGKGSKGYWYCFFVGIKPEFQGQGLSRPLMSPHTPTPSYPLAPSHTAHHPIWLEATTPRSRAVYAKLGYELVGEVRVAKGAVDERGMTKKGGEGVPMWGMYIASHGQGNGEGEGQGVAQVGGGAEGA